VLKSMCLILLIFIGFVGILPVSAKDSYEQEFAGMEHQWVEALEKHDVATLDRLLSEDFMDSTFRGAIRDKKAILSGPRVAPAYHSSGFEELKVRVYGSDMAIVTGINVLQGSSPADVARIRFTDVFVRQNGQWRAVSAQETLQTKEK